MNGASGDNRSGTRPRLVAGADGPLRMLVVGAQSWTTGLEAGLAADPTTVFVDFCDITAEVLADVAPDLVVSMVIGPGFDVLDLARRLDTLRFAGRYRAVIRGQEHAEMIRAEVTAAAPGLDFDIYHA